MDLKVIEKIKEPLKSFETVDDFNKYYMKHKSMIDECTTHKLNKMYYIKDHRLTRIQGELQLKKCTNDDVNESCVDGSQYAQSELIKRIEKLETELIEHKRVISGLVNYINNSGTA